MVNKRWIPRKGYYPRRPASNMRVVNVRFPIGVLEKIDLLIEHKMYANRNEAIRTFVNDGIKEEILVLAPSKS